MEKTWFVYKHTSPSNKVYIGITSQKPIYRWNNGLGYNKQQYFWRAIQKYGWENFFHEILFEGLGEEEAKEKMRKKKNKPVAQIDVETGEVIRVWESIKVAKESLHIGHISEVCGSNPKYQTAGGYRWRYAEESDT